MVLITLIKEAFAALWANKLRSFLTLLGIVVGVTSVIAIVSTVEGMQSSIEDGLMSLGPKTFMVTRFGLVTSYSDFLERRKRKKLTRGLLPIIEDGCPDCEEVGAEGYSREHVKYGGTRMRWVEIDGQTPNILAMRDLDVAMGRFISWEDDRRRGQVAFLGHRVYEKLFVNEDPIGKRIRLGEREFIVIGVAEEVGGLLGEDMDEFVVIPLSTLQKIYHRPGNPVNLIISSTTLEKREIAMDQVRVVLRSARRLPYEENDDFEILTPDAIVSFINDITRAFRVLLVSLPLLSIVVGGIVIMNIMMITVTERTREIGIRKSIGARSGHILAQFLYESVILSLFGGIVGICFGIWIGSEMLSGWMDITITPTTMAIILGFGISTTVGVFFGIYPAMKAARLDPIKALGYE